MVTLILIGLTSNKNKMEKGFYLLLIYYYLLTGVNLPTLFIISPIRFLLLSDWNFKKVIFSTEFVLIRYITSFLVP